MKPILISLYLLATVTAGGIGDGLNHAGVLSWGHALEDLELLLAISGPVIFGIRSVGKLALWLLALAFCYASLFDIAFNLAAGNDLFYVEPWGWRGKFWAAIKVPPFGAATIRAFFLAAGVGITINEL